MYIYGCNDNSRQKKRERERCSFSFFNLFLFHIKCTKQFAILSKGLWKCILRCTYIWCLQVLGLYSNFAFTQFWNGFVRFRVLVVKLRNITLWLIQRVNSYGSGLDKSEKWTIQCHTSFFHYFLYKNIWLHLRKIPSFEYFKSIIFSYLHTCLPPHSPFSLTSTIMESLEDCFFIIKNLDMQFNNSLDLVNMKEKNIDIKLLKMRDMKVCIYYLLLSNKY